jgi:hypothetical protein
MWPFTLQKMFVDICYHQNITSKMYKIKNTNLRPKGNALASLHTKANCYMN